MPEPVLPENARQSFLEFVRKQSRGARAADQPPQSAEEWSNLRKQLRSKFARALGEFPPEPCDLDPQIVGTIERDGYRIERLMFQTRPGIWMTANAYLPAGDGKRPAVLSVHGHWAWARVDPVPHARAVGLVKLGYFVLAVDAFGAGERAIEPARGTYHGALLGASTWPVGTPLLGLQVYDNMRAVDYLITRPEVDADKLAITGASGGGNQSMNAGAWDERLKAVVPVCSVGTYDAYLGAACCVCEVLPGALAFAEEGDILALVAPRALMVINATRDAHQFSPGEAEKSIARARPVFELLAAADRIKHVVVDSAHDYNKPMRESMYGWLARWLRGEGDGSPIAEPELTLEEIESLRLFPDNVRPKTFGLLPGFVEQQAKQKITRLPRPDHREHWEAASLLMKTRLEQQIFGGFPRQGAWKAESAGRADGEDTRVERIVLYPEPEMPVPGLLVRHRDEQGPFRTAVLIDPAGKDAALAQPGIQQLIESGWQIFAIDLRATGETAHLRDGIRNAPDHNSVEWSVWLGRPLLGQWCWDVIRSLDYLVTRDDVQATNMAIIGIGAGGLAAVCAGALDERAAAVVALDTLASYASEGPFDGHRMATFVPFMLEVGDVAHLAALLAPRRLVLGRPVNAQNQKLDAESAVRLFEFTDHTYGWFRATSELRVEADFENESLRDALRRI